jgi:pimeloyl-ACP methyl ester carboxylesterase
MRKLLYISITSFILIGCQRLDALLFNPDNSITEYLLDDYTSDHYSFFKLDSQYDIPDSLVEVFILPTSEENDIYAIYVGDKSKIATDTIIIYNHGNSGTMDWYWQRTKLLANCGGKNRFGVLMIDYSGFGMSGGTPSEELLYNDVDLAMKWLKNNGLTSDRLVMYGFSMGTAPTCELTSKPKTLEPFKIILEAPFASAEVMVQDGSQLAMPGSFLTNLKIDNAEEIKNVNQPLLWIHGKADDFVQISHGETVFANHSGIFKEAHRLDGAEHSTCPQTLGYETYNQIVLDFILR